MSGRGNPCNAVEFIDEDGQRWAWSESNVQYEKVGPDSGSFYLLQQRLTRLQGAARHYLRLSKPFSGVDSMVAEQDLRKLLP